MSRRLLEEVFSEAGFELSEEDLRRFETYLAELTRWNRVHNLTSVKEERQIVVRHFLDSLSLAVCFRDVGLDWKSKDIADVGSGAGFPGVPLKIYLKDFNLYLIESVSKKCSFLEFLKVKLGLDWTVICARAEKVSRRFHIVVSRALGEFEEIYPLLERLSLSHVFVMKGESIKREWIDELGYNLYEVRIKGLPKSYILWKELPKLK